MTEILNRAQLRGPLTSRTNSHMSNPWIGVTQINSNATTVTVSTTLVKSDSIIFCQEQHTDVTSAYPLQVRTIIDSTSFVISRSNGGALAARQTKVYWWIVNQKEV